MTDSDSPRLLVTLCTYNERENLEILIPEIHKQIPYASILVIDDNSPDGTGEYAKDLKKTDQRIHSIHRSGKLGLGTATVAGFQYAVENQYDLVLNMDADFSHPPRFMPDLVEATNRADVAIGSRYVSGGKIEGWGPKRYFMSGAINWYAFVTPLEITRLQWQFSLLPCLEVSRNRFFSVKGKRLCLSGRDSLSLPSSGLHFY